MVSDRFTLTTTTTLAGVWIFVAELLLSSGKPPYAVCYGSLYAEFRSAQGC